MEREHLRLLTTRVKGGMAVYLELTSPALLNCSEYSPGLRFYLAAILKYAVDFPRSIWKLPFIVRKSVPA